MAGRPAEHYNSFLGKLPVILNLVAFVSSRSTFFLWPYNRCHTPVDSFHPAFAHA